MAKKKSKRKNKPSVNESVIEDGRSTTLSLGNGWQNFWSKPINGILLKFFILMIVFYAFWAVPFFQQNVIEPISNLYAFMASKMLNVLGYGTTAIRDTLGNNDFSISIKNGCDGVEGLAILLCAIAIYPATFSQKGKGIFFGFVFLVLLNLIRIISLYLIGTHLPSMFDVMHESVWQVLFILLTLLALFKWVGWTKTTEQTNK